MVRAPCCEKMGLKKGPWTSEEDQILITYIQKHGHGNWRALPKQAGLLRCGKSCRLRWTNYLRPDIKRGNFSKEEEDTIVKLHEMLGNRWSVIASRLPGRTDNEIKNVWHTHLKKRLKQNHSPNTHYFEISKYEANIGGESKPKPKPKSKPNSNSNSNSSSSSKSNSNSNSNSEYQFKSELIDIPTPLRFENPSNVLISPQQSCSNSSVGTSENHSINIKNEYIDPSENFPKFEENLWAEALPEEFPAIATDPRFQLPFSPISKIYNTNDDGGMDFWFNIFMETGELSELPELWNNLGLCS